MTGEPSQTPSPIIGHGQDILQACLRSGEAFDKAAKEGDPLILQALAAFKPAREMRAEPSPRPLPMEQDPQIDAALARFQHSLGK